MAERKAISKKVRFEVFKRDSFTCQYCSAKPPHAPLEIDHVIPVCKGGVNDIDNLITACFDCNRGKSGEELTSIPMSLTEKSERLKIAKTQYLQYKKHLQKQRELIDADIDEVEEVYECYFEDYGFRPKFRVTVKNFIDKIGIEETRNSMEKACSKIHQSEDALRYFCGICWNIIKNN